MRDSLIDSLNDAQRAAVMHGDGPLLVLAGAGTGKTRVITARVARLIADGVDPARILAVTFTNKAAREMRERIARSGPSREGPLVATFHAFGARLLRSEAEAAGLHPGFSIADETDQLASVREALRAAGVGTDAFNPNLVRWKISLWKNGGIGADQALETSSDPLEEAAARAYGEYDPSLRRRRAVDFDDLILLPARLLETDDGVRTRWRNRFDHVLVDEYQDTNACQFRLLRALLPARPNLCVVGDDDQSIYGWRGAELRHIRRFAEVFRGAEVVTLEENYRSTNTILAAANQVIARNPGRHPKNLWSALGDGEAIQVYLAEDERDEAEHVAIRIGRLRAAGARFDAMAVLFRANAQARPIEESLRARRVPYRVVGGLSYFDRKEVRDLLAYLRVALDPSDEDALLRIVNTPPRGIGRKTVERLNAASLAEKVPLAAALRSLGDSPTTAFADLLADLGARSAAGGPASLLAYVIGATGYRAFLALEHKDELTRAARSNVVDDLVRSAEAFERRSGGRGVRGFLDEILLDDRGDEDADAGDRVSLLTIHASKGLEFGHVFLVGAEDGLLPHKRSLAGEDGASDGSLDEERRLFYVALTRARRTLTITRPLMRSRAGRQDPTEPTPFLDDVAPALLAVTDGRRLEPASQEDAQSRIAELRKRFERKGGVPSREER